MARKAFIVRSRHTVNRKDFKRCLDHEYAVASINKPAPPPARSLLFLARHDSEEHTRTWERARRGAEPKVKLVLKNIDPHVVASHRLRMLVDTGACISTMKEETAELLGIDRRLAEDEEVATFQGVTGLPLIGVRRWIYVDLGGSRQLIPVLVAPLREHLRNKVGDPIGCAPALDVLGTAEILEDYLLCLDAERLYTFRRKRRRKADPRARRRSRRMRRA